MSQTARAARAPHRLAGMAAKAVVAAMSISMLATACSGAPSTRSEDLKTDTTYTWLTARSQNDSTVKAVQAVAAAYTKEHPEFTLDVQTVADRPAFDQKFRLLASSNALPDLFDADPEPFFRQVVDSGIVVDVKALYGDLGVADKFYPVSTAYPTWDDGSNNLITLNANAEYFFYNKALFTQAGVKPPKTLDELLGTCDQLTDKGITPIAINGKDLWPYYRYLGMPAFRATGNQFLDDLKNGKASMTDPVGIQSATFLQDVGRCFQDGFSNTDYTTAINLFTSGKAAMVYDGTWELPSFTDKDGNLKKDIGYFTMPTKGADDVAPPTDFYANSGIGTAILKKSLNPELKDFLAYFFAHYAETAFYDYGVIPSIRPEIRDSVAPVYRDVLDDIAGVKTFAKVWDVQLDPNTGAVMGREGTNLLLKKETPEEFGQKVDASVKEFLATK